VAKFVSSNDMRLKIVKSAVGKVARRLNFKMEMMKCERVGSIFVFYRDNLGVEIPVYSDFKKKCDVEDVYKAIMNILFVLSFHPNHNSLKDVRKEIM
jgi:hypothetical protein